MIISSRKIPPTTAMRRVPSANSTPTLTVNPAELTAKYGFRQFLDSPLPSPALPSIVPRHGKKPDPYRFRRFLRVMLRVSIWCCGLLVIYWLGLRLIYFRGPPTGHSVLVANPEQEALLKEPTAVVVVDRKGKPKWTVAIPPLLPFPLMPNHYTNICHQSDQLRKLQSPKGETPHDHHYYRKDPHFMDIAEAQKELLLVTRNHEMDYRENGLVGVDGSHENSRQGNIKICERSLTYVLESPDAGLGLTLMGLWMSYGLAKKEGRGFFIDDSNWYFHASVFLLPVCAHFSLGHMENTQRSLNHPLSNPAAQHQRTTASLAHTKLAIWSSRPQQSHGPLALNSPKSFRIHISLVIFLKSAFSLSFVPGTTLYSTFPTLTPDTSQSALRSSATKSTCEAASASAFTSAVATAILGSFNTKTHTSLYRLIYKPLMLC